jgi:hypothetical protein
MGLNAGQERDSDARGDARRPSRRRVVIALVLAFGALVAAALAAHGPAVQQRAEFTWPPTELPAGTPTRSWFTPLFVARHRVERLDAQVPCGPAQTLGDRKGTKILLATARGVAEWGALEVKRSPELTISVRVGRQRLARLQTLQTAAPCSLRIRVEGKDWVIERSGRVVARGLLDEAVGVSGLITDLDLRTAPTPRLAVAVRPYAQDTRPSTQQTLLRVLAAAMLFGAVASLVPMSPRRLRWPRPAGTTAQDYVVLVLIGVWWLLSPLYFDDGWIRARETNALTSGGFSSYYEQWGTNLPLATWLEWLQQFVVAHTSSLAVHRVPAVGLLVLTWLVCRHCLSRILSRRPTRSDLAWWSATLVFCLGVVAFGMTLRPEPVVALLTVGVLAATLTYTHRPTSAPLVASVVFIGLAVTAHPAGLVAATPLAVCIPRLWRDVRKEAALSVGAVIVTAVIGLAWTVLLAFIDSDLVTRGGDAARFRQDGTHSLGVFQELHRYGNLSAGGASVVRREFAALLLLTPIAWLVTRRARRTFTERIPTAALALSLLVLTTTPSKWIWHFGGLIGLAAVAIGVEISRLAERPGSPLGRWVTAAAVICAGMWAASEAWEWGPLDVVTVRWTSIPGPFVLGIVAGSTAVLVLWRAKRVQRPDLACLGGTIAGLIGMTFVVLTADAAATPGWTAPRQALASLVGRDGCGVADDIVVPTVSSMRALHAVEVSALTHDAYTGRRVPVSPATNVWYGVPTGSMGILVRLRRPTDTPPVAVWGRMTGGKVRRLDAADAIAVPGTSEWTFPLGSRPRNADAILVNPGGDSATRLSRPVSYRRERLTDILTRHPTRALVDPFLLEATPCARLPRLNYGVVETPRLLIQWFWGPANDRPTSPFLATLDLFDLVHVPVEAWRGNRAQIRMQWALPDPRDAIAPTTRHLITS